MTEIEKLEAEIADRNEQTAKLEKRLAELKDIQVQPVKTWVATDKDGDVFLYNEKPRRGESVWLSHDAIARVMSFNFPFTTPTWEDEPIKLLITIQKA